jgi:hypothetical protein
MQITVHCGSGSCLAASCPFSVRPVRVCADILDNVALGQLLLCLLHLPPSVTFNRCSVLISSSVTYAI